MRADKNSQLIPFFSPTTKGAPWIISLALLGFLLVLNIWGWARRGYTWTTILFPVGALLLMLSYRNIRPRPWLSLVFYAIAMSLLIAGTFFTLRGLGRL